MFKKLFQLLLAGLSTLLPISLTIFIVYRVFLFIDGIFGGAVEKFIGHKIIGLGFVMTLLVILLVGILTKNFIAQRLLQFIESITLKIPIIQDIYSSIKEISTLFTQEGVKHFSEVVAIQFPNAHTTSLGFVTKKSVLINHEKKVGVFIPTTPNPGNGFLIYVREEELTHLDISIDKAIKSIVSMGSITPDFINEKTIR